MLHQTILHLIQEAIPHDLPLGKQGQRILQPTIASALQKAGFEADLEDKRQFLKSQMPVWRLKSTAEIETTPKRRAIDIVVYKNSLPVALIETESDLDNLQKKEAYRKDARYNVWSIAKSANGQFFNSYRSLERMAAAAFYFYLEQRDGKYPAVALGPSLLESLMSDSPSEHNPNAVSLFLVSGRCRSYDRCVLGPRIEALSAELICCRICP